MEPCSPIIDILSKATLAGHSYLPLGQLMLQLSGSSGVDSQDAQALLELATASGEIVVEDQRVYLSKNHLAEETLADFVYDALHNAHRPSRLIAALDRCPMLNQEQRLVTILALNSRLCLITGGAGTGKSYILGAIALLSGELGGCLFCAPTGKAAQNITDSTGYPAVTVHSALGVLWNGDLTQPKRDLSAYHTIIVDEASMLTLEMLAGLVKAASPECWFVLVGDSKQLLPVGCGNLLSDLDALGVPRANLTTVYRQSDRESALYQNVTRFGNITNSCMFSQDNSFVLIPTEEQDVKNVLLQIAQPLFRASRSAVILTPRAELTDLDVKCYNAAMQSLLQTPDLPGFEVDGQMFYDRDQVMFCLNNHSEGYINGTTGVLRHSFNEFGQIVWHVQCPNGVNIPLTEGAKKHLSLAYSLTVHKSQGSSFQQVLMPLSMQFARQLTRNMLYTALSRARKQVILVGNPLVLDYALQNLPTLRNLTLVERVRQKPDLPAA